jgi:hypothetical protein
MNDDSRLIAALEHANYKMTLVQQQKNLRLKFTNDSLYAHNGGIFTVSPALMSMVDLLIRQNQTDTILLDDKNIPIKIKDLKDFQDDIMSVYGEATNDYHIAWEALRKARTVEAVIKA